MNVFGWQKLIICYKRLCYVATKSKLLHDKIFYCYEYLWLSWPYKIVDIYCNEKLNRYIIKCSIAIEEDLVVITYPVRPIKFLSQPMRRFILRGHEAQ
jgi:hypothetical protein